MSLPSPHTLGLPRKFVTWRTDQEAAIWDMLESSHRFPCLTAPTGAGKSAIYVAYAMLRRWELDPGQRYRALILTATRALQDQLSEEFAKLSSDVRGQSNYPCEIQPVTVDKAPCHGDWQCHLKTKGCRYFDTVRRAAKVETVVSNYAFWFHARRTKAIGAFDLLVCDEAHAALQVLSDHLRIRITNYEIHTLLGMEDPPDDAKRWPTWATQARVRLKKLIVSAGQVAAKYATNFSPSGAHSQVSYYRDIADRLARLEAVNPIDWIMQREMGGNCIWDVVRPGDYAENLLFRRTPKVILVSATLGDATLDMLKVPASERLRREYPSRVPVSRRPVYYIPTTRVDRSTSPTQLRYWLTRIDNIVRSRGDRKGVIHAVSYSRAQYILHHSNFRDRMISHADAGGIQQAVYQFKTAPPGAVLVSPSATTGLDFPYELCEYQVIAKVPYPDGRDLVVAARTAEWKDWPKWQAIQTVVQAAGRAIRSSDDWAECFIVDDHWSYLRKSKAYAPRWFWDACREVATLPDPIARSRG